MFQSLQAEKFATYTLAQLVDANAIKTAIATDTSEATYSAAALNGVLANPGPAVMRMPQGFYVKTSSSVGSYNATDPIVVTGTSDIGAQTASIYLDADGNEDLITDVGFMSVVSIYVPAQVDTNGQFEFGVSDIITTNSRPLIVVEYGSAANIDITFGDGVRAVEAGAANSQYGCCAIRIHGSASTTADPIRVQQGRSLS